jgi:cytoskeletal protein CcmA (bactofilin family)
VRNEAKDFSIIDTSLSIEGTLATRGKLIVKGTIKGTLTGETVIIAKEGAVYARVRAASMTIGGTFEGEVQTTEALIILSTGKCSGKVICRDFVVEAGGRLNAEVICTAGHNSGKALPAPAAS